MILCPRCGAVPDEIMISKKLVRCPCRRLTGNYVGKLHSIHGIFQWGFGHSGSRRLVLHKNIVVMKTMSSGFSMEVPPDDVGDAIQAVMIAPVLDS